MMIRKLLFTLLALGLVVKASASVLLNKEKSFASQVRAANTLYEIRDAFDLRGATVKVPSGCTLVFSGGSVKNGTLDLNGCRIEGVGIKCRIKNPSDYAYPLSRYLADESNAELNVSVVQSLMDAAVPVIIDYPRLTFSRHLLVGSNVTIQSASEKRVSLYFPDSRGFVFNRKVYSQNNTFRGLHVQSKNHCFDFANGGEAERPINVYFSTFSNMRVQSEEGDCFTAGQGNYGATGDALTFDNLFELIEVKAPKGCGFVGLTGNTHHFTKIRCLGCGVAFFCNCSGVFDSCNGTWGDSRTFYKGTRRDKDNAERYTCIFRNCNVESYNGVLFDCIDARCYMELSLENCSFFIKPNKDKKIDFFPFDFSVLLKLSMRNNYFHVYNGGKYDSKHCLMRVNSLSNILHLDLDNEIEIKDYYSVSYKASKQSVELKKSRVSN